ncbi:hypothetical protein B0H17DRAFT_1206848 [Mycena rosella]|uniref:Transposase n=1 Tax=Mycena rosella TaxID=1033263 RepID=A0AAD7G8S2_MYCRO|nr:hypothetical protein B0H17DRAFT_1206848 [Mycena rosella]
MDKTLTREGILSVLLLPGETFVLAEYPEKVLLATIKYFGGCPCPRCFVEKSQIPEMGTKADMRRRKHVREDNKPWRDKIDTVRQWIFGKGGSVTGEHVNRNLKSKSWVPLRNAFSKLTAFGFNLFSMFVPDLLHEVELGVVKSLFIHTLRILQAYASDAIGKLDERRFHATVSEMKKLAAHDFEDILQCLLPVLEGLLPEPHNGILLDLWFTLATWHADAKLRIHSSSTVQRFTSATTELDATATAKTAEDRGDQSETLAVPAAPLPATPNPIVETLQPQDDELPRTHPCLHHHISESKRTPLDVYGFPALMAGDPAVEGFLPKLRSHLLSRILKLLYDGDETQFSPQELLDVTFEASVKKD